MKDKKKIKDISEIKGICDGIGDGISVQDTDYVILYQNQAHIDIIGDHVGEYCYKAFEQKGNVCEGCPLIVSFNDGKAHTTERTVSTDKGKIYLEITSSPLKDSSGEVIAGVEVVRDVTERKKVENKLRLTESQLRTSMESLPFDFFVIGEDGCYLMQNNICKAHWGDVIGKRPEDLSVDNEMLNLWIDNNRRAFSGETIKGEVTLVVNGEKRHHFNIISPIRDDNKIAGIVGINIDIDEHKKAELEVIRRAEELEGFYKMAVGREVKMIELKEEIEKLKSKLSQYKNSI